MTLHYAKEGHSSHSYKPKIQDVISHKVDYEYRDGKYGGGYFQNFNFVKVPKKTQRS